MSAREGERRERSDGADRWGRGVGEREGRGRRERAGQRKSGPKAGLAARFEFKFLFLLIKANKFK